ncbi:MAG: hypothetical protein H6576_14245 [Lewinellaceae bacterium]|nr:hypothetical protein [Lewinellaceae bacterium]
MKIVLIVITLVAVAALFIFCKHQQTFTADNLPTLQLRWGTGGGIVGKETTLTLLENGQIFKQGFKGEATEVGKIKAKVAKSLIKKAEMLELGKREFNHPGNIYSFLEYQEGDMISRITWGDQAYTVDADVQALFDQLNSLLRKE